MHNPWTITGEKHIYANPWIELTEYQVINPGGNPGIYGKVHFRNQAIGVVPYENGKVWMVGQYRFTLDAYSWEIPEGGCPEGEDALATAKRELLEETGLQAENYRPLLQMHLSNSVSDEWGLVYLATGLTKGEAQPDDTEEIMVKQMSVEELYREVEAGHITDSMTVAAAYKLMLLKVKGAL
jgi:8-oxo-dGTP pyrophosphatase MutT (NUDIX family)